MDVISKLQHVIVLFFYLASHDLLGETELGAGQGDLVDAHDTHHHGRLLIADSFCQFVNRTRTNCPWERAKWQRKKDIHTKLLTRKHTSINNNRTVYIP